MPFLNTILLSLACLIIMTLAGYALYLHLQIKKNKRNAIEKENAERERAQANLTKRNNGIIADIRFIAQSLISNQCEITEAVMRIHYLADALDSDLMIQDEFAAIHNHFNGCRTMAIKDAYKNLSKKERFQQDQKRFRLEEANRNDVLKEAELIIKYSFSNLKNLH